MENFTELKTTEAVTTPIDSIREYHQERSEVVQGLRAGEMAVSQARKAAIESAAAPYDQKLNELRSEINQAEALLSPGALEKLLREKMASATPLIKASFELLMARHEIDIPAFIASLTNDRYPSQVIAEQLEGISTLSHAVETTQELPIFYFSLNWFEEEEVRFDNQPRTNTTEFWMKQLSGTLARAGQLVVGSEQIALPDSLAAISKPRSITLDTNSVHKFESVYDWGSLKATQKQLDHDSITILSLLTSFDRQRDMIDWEKSKAQDFSLLRESLHGQMLRESDPLVFCIYGHDAVRQAMQQLRQDESLPEDMKSILLDLQENIG